MKYIKVSIKGCIKNLNTKEINKFQVLGIKKDNSIYYIIENNKYKINYNDSKLIMIRENQNYNNKMIFESHTTTLSNYYIYKLGNLDINIYTELLKITFNKIHIKYQIIETKETFEYKIELSENNNEY